MLRPAPTTGGQAIMTALKTRHITILPVGADPSYRTAVHEMFADGMLLYANQFDKSSTIHSYWLAYVREALQGDLSDEGIRSTYTDTGGFWVAVDSETNSVLGCVGAQRISDNVCELRRMSISMKARKRGIAQLLIWWLEEWAVGCGFSQVVLTTGSVMVPAKALYLAAGYELYEIKQMGKPQQMQTADGSKQVIELSQLAFRKVLTSNAGRWVWNPHPAALSAL